MIDVDLAEIYGVETRHLNEKVRGNLHRFPKDFMHQLTTQEKTALAATRNIPNRAEFFETRSFAFTEYGAVMLAAVLSSSQAIKASIEITRTFVRLNWSLNIDNYPHGSKNWSGISGHMKARSPGCSRIWTR